MTIQEFIGFATRALSPQNGEREARAMTKIYVQTKLRMPAHELALRILEPLTTDQQTCFMADLERMLEGCPVQYVLGETAFYGRTFEVSPAVLIPRPETEELVQQVVQRVNAIAMPKIWDVGTGSGCIAVSLACELPQAQVFATDISQAALQVAQHNAQTQGVKITFAQHNMLDGDKLPFSTAQFDVLVSNPPYIPEKERPTLQRCVRDYEPDEALFVPDQDPLLFFRALAMIGRNVLKENGLWAVETYEDFHNEMADMLINVGYKDIESLEDINGHRRMMIARIR